MVAPVNKLFRPYELNQRLLLPPDLREWLPEDHLAFCVSDVVEALDLSGIFTSSERGAGRGQPPYDPVLMVKQCLRATPETASTLHAGPRPRPRWPGNLPLHTAPHKQQGPGYQGAWGAAAVQSLAPPTRQRARCTLTPAPASSRFLSLPCSPGEERATPPPNLLTYYYSQTFLTLTDFVVTTAIPPSRKRSRSYAASLGDRKSY